MVIYLISVHFGFHLCFNNKISLFILSLICIFNLSFNRFKIYLFICISTCCMFFFCYDCLFNFCFFWGFIYSLIVISGRFEFELLYVSIFSDLKFSIAFTFL